MTRSETITGIGIIFLMMAAGACESAIIAMVVPITYIVTEPNRFAASGIGKRIVNYLGTNAVHDLFLYFVVAFIILLIVSNLMTMASRYLSEAHSARCVNRMARDVVERCLSAPYLW